MRHRSFLDKWHTRLCNPLDFDEIYDTLFVKSSKKFEITNEKINIKSHIKADKKKKLPTTSGIDDILNALILGTKDYAEKNGFEKCLISLSGGIDSALVTTIACKAMGTENVRAVTLSLIHI